MDTEKIKKIIEEYKIKYIIHDSHQKIQEEIDKVSKTRKYNVQVLIN